jgi:hypothetical protein
LIRELVLKTKPSTTLTPQLNNAEASFMEAAMAMGIGLTRCWNAGGIASLKRITKDASNWKGNAQISIARMESSGQLIQLLNARSVNATILVQVSGVLRAAGAL